MSKRTLQQELDAIDTQLSELEDRRTALIHRLENSGVRKSALTSIIKFPRTVGVTETVSESDDWPHNPCPKQDSSQ
jgi:hypothetical protein